MGRGRQSGGFGPQPLAYSELLAWVRLRGTEPTPFEIDAIMQIDAAYMSFEARKNDG